MTKTAAKPAPKTVSLVGKRAVAFANIAQLSYGEGESRAASLANMRIVLGALPSADEVKAARAQWIIGRLASRLPATTLPRGTNTPEKRLAFALSLVTLYAAPPKEGVQAKALRKGQIGRRTPTQQRFVRSAEEACSVFFAELNLSKAKTNKQRDEAKKEPRAPSMAGSGKGKAAAPSHAELVKPAAQWTADDYVQHMATQSAALLATDNKHAKLRPIEFNVAAELLAQFKSAVNKAAAEYKVRMSK